jgi:hypothetical protein
MGRRWGTQLIVIAFPAGLLLYGFFCYRVLMAGGLSGMSIRPTCSVKAVIGSENSRLPVRRISPHQTVLLAADRGLSMVGRHDCGTRPGKRP